VNVILSGLNPSPIIKRRIVPTLTTLATLANHAMDVGLRIFRIILTSEKRNISLNSKRIKFFHEKNANS